MNLVFEAPLHGPVQSHLGVSVMRPVERPDALRIVPGSAALVWRGRGAQVAVVHDAGISARRGRRAIPGERTHKAQSASCSN